MRRTALPDYGHGTAKQLLNHARAGLLAAVALALGGLPVAAQVGTGAPAGTTAPAATKQSSPSFV